MVTHAGFLTGLPKRALKGMIDVVKGVEPETGYGAILQVSEAESAMRDTASAAPRPSAPIAASAAASTSGRRTATSSRSRPSTDPTNGISTCVKGKFGWGFVNSQDRLTTPLIRERRIVSRGDWDEALALVGAPASLDIKAESGPDALGFISSSKCTNEESFLMQKLARAVVGHQQRRQLLALLPGAGDDGLCSARSATAATRVDRRHRAGRTALIIAAIRPRVIRCSPPASSAPTNCTGRS